MNDGSGAGADLPRRRLWQAVAVGVAGVACSGRDPEAVSSAARPVAQRDDVSAEPLDFEYPPGHRAFIVKLGRPANGGVGPDGDIVAFHRACPHRGCAIGDVDLERGELGPCPCHMSTFDLANSGLQVFGVACQNLVQVVLEERDGGGIHAVGLVGVPYGEPPRKT